MVNIVKSAASIVITLDYAGRARMESVFMGRHDATYGQMDDARLIEQELPKLLGELRNQIQALSGSTVTE
jgi:hypothetical protein